MTRRVDAWLATVIFSGAVALGCGGAPTVPDAPDAPETPSGDDMPSADDATPEAPSDGIIRDADGDGNPDDSVGGCEGLDKTKCQITSGCAWTTDEKCDEAKGSMM